MTKAPALEPGQILVDTREQRPLFKCPPSQRVTLTTGDYSVEGLSAVVAIERKSIADAYGSVGRGRDRLRAAFERLATIRYRAVVIEGSMTDIMKAKRWGRVQPAHVLGTVGSWAMEYHVPVFFCDTRAMTKWYVHTLLRIALKKAVEDMNEGLPLVSNGNGRETS